MPDFWRHSGFHLLSRDTNARLRVTEDFLRAYLLRPEIRPVEESGARETALHESLMEDPRRPVPETEIERIEDQDARENYRVLLGFRQRLLDAETVENCYLGIFTGGNVAVPPLFVDQLAHIIVRNVLDGSADGLEARTAELFFREQSASVRDGAVMLADLETVRLHASGAVHGSLGRLIAEAQSAARAVNLDVLDRDNAAAYWARDERHDFVVGIGHGRAAGEAYCRVIENWIAHFIGLRVQVNPVPRIEDERWSWHVGLDATSTAVLNGLWRGEEVDPGRLARLLALYRLEFADAADMRSDVAGRPVYLALGMDDSNVVRMKPQNLLLNLPLASRSQG